MLREHALDGIFLHGAAADPFCVALRREHARSIPGKSQVFVNAYARALEVIPRQLCDNAGFDATDVLSRLRNKHALSEDRGTHFGIDIATGEGGST